MFSSSPLYIYMFYYKNKIEKYTRRKEHTLQPRREGEREGEREPERKREKERERERENLNNKCIIHPLAHECVGRCSPCPRLGDGRSTSIFLFFFFFFFLLLLSE